MTTWEAALLGVVQGVTEFLPISSSGHLVLVQQFLEVDRDGFTFDVFLHFATLAAVVLFLWKDLFKLRFKDMIPLAIGSIPAALIGIMLHDQLEVLFASGATIGWELLVTAGINFWSDRILNKSGATENAAAKQDTEPAPPIAAITPKTALAVGFAQAFAIMPAISRSGTTVLTGLLSGLDRTTAFKYSFMLSIPAILGANLLELVKIFRDGQQLPDTGLLVSGGLTAFISGLLSLYLLNYMIKRAKFEVFGWYCVALGLVVLYFQYFSAPL
jgi:undecaprenyl-diphosphatase